MMDQGRDAGAGISLLGVEFVQAIMLELQSIRQELRNLQQSQYTEQGLRLFEGRCLADRITALEATLRHGTTAAPGTPAAAPVAFSAALAEEE